MSHSPKRTSWVIKWETSALWTAEHWSYVKNRKKSSNIPVFMFALLCSYFCDSKYRTFHLSWLHFTLLSWGDGILDPDSVNLCIFYSWLRLGFTLINIFSHFHPVCCWKCWTDRDCGLWTGASRGGCVMSGHSHLHSTWWGGVGLGEDASGKQRDTNLLHLAPSPQSGRGTQKQPHWNVV